MLESIDILGQPLTFTVKKQKIFKTNFGGIASIFLVIIAGITFFGFGRDIFEKLKPKVTFNRIVNTEVPSLNVTDKYFLFALYDQLTNQPIPDFERRFQNYFDYTEIFGDGKFKLTRVYMEKCSDEVKVFWKGLFAVSSDLYWCIPKGSFYEIKGSSSGMKKSTMRFQTDYCKNNTDPTKGIVQTNCIEKDDTLKLLTSNRIQMHYILQDSLINTNNYTHPSTNIPFTAIINTNAASWTRMQISLKQVDFKSDNGFFTEEIELTRSYNIDKVSVESLYSLGTTTIYSNLLAHSQWVEVYNRNYIKVQDAFALMGGFLNLSVIILKLLVNYLSRPQLVDIFNILYKYKSLKEEKNSTGNYLYSNRNSILKNTPISNRVPKASKISDTELKENQENILKSRNLTKVSLKSLNSGIIVEKSGNIKHFNENFDKCDSEKRKVLSEYNSTNNEKNLTMEKNNFFDMINKKSKVNYSLDMNVKKRACVLCFKNTKKFRLNYLVYNKVDEKLTKVSGVENIIKLTRNVKLAFNLIFEDYQKALIKFCPAPITKQKYTRDKLCDKFLDRLKEGNDKINLNLMNCFEN